MSDNTKQAIYIVMCTVALFFFIRIGPYAVINYYGDVSDGAAGDGCGGESCGGE